MIQTKDQSVRDMYEEEEDEQKGLARRVCLLYWVFKTCSQSLGKGQWFAMKAKCLSYQMFFTSCLYLLQSLRNRFF